jgi:hypothetical protein
MPLHDQETFPAEPAGLTLGATGFAGAGIEVAISRLVIRIGEMPFGAWARPSMIGPGPPR